MARPSTLLTSSSLLMAILFAFSASVQFNDPDWYLWFPLYSLASLVNILNNKSYKSIRKTIRKVAKLDLLLGIFLFMKVVIEDYVKGLAGFWSMDLSERVVREKMGSGFVVIAMFLQLIASGNLNKLRVGGKKVKVAPRFVDYGMALLASVSYCISLVFFVFLKGDATT